MQAVGHTFSANKPRKLSKTARTQVADLIGASPEEIIFTSGATESNNLATLGLAEAGIATGRKHILSTAIEHKAILEPLQKLRTMGFEIELAPVTAGGFVEPNEIRRRLRKDTLLVSVMHSNNETGVLQPVSEIAELTKQTATFFHTDAAQTYGKEVESLTHLQCDLISISGHKIYGPKGVGALYVRRRSNEKRALNPLQFGGGQERTLRPGTLPVPLIVGLGVAARIAGSEYAIRRERAANIKRNVLLGLQDIEHRINGDQTRTQSHVLNVCLPGVDSEALMMSLRNEFAFSNGSACTSTSYHPSHVLLAMGVNSNDTECSIRLSWGEGIEQLDIASLVSRAHQLSLR